MNGQGNLPEHRSQGPDKWQKVRSWRVRQGDRDHNIVRHSNCSEKNSESTKQNILLAWVSGGGGGVPPYYKGSINAPTNGMISMLGWGQSSRKRFCAPSTPTPDCLQSGSGHWVARPGFKHFQKWGADFSSQLQH